MLCCESCEAFELQVVAFGRKIKSGRFWRSMQVGARATGMDEHSMARYSGRFGLTQRGQGVSCRVGVRADSFGTLDPRCWSLHVAECMHLCMGGFVFLTINL